MGSQGRVIAFEPLQANADYLSQHILLNNCTNVEVKSIAIGDTQGPVTFAVGRSRFMGYITEEQTGLQVDCDSLDNLVRAGQPLPNVIKIDVEGAEAKLLRGAMNTLERCHPIILLATHSNPLHLACLAILRELGYSVSPITAKTNPYPEQTDEILAVWR